MTFDLFAFTEILDFSVDDENEPLRIYEPSKVQRVFIDNFKTRAKAVTAIKEVDHVSFVLDGRDWVIPASKIRLFEIVEVP